MSHTTPKIYPKSDHRLTIGDNFKSLLEEKKRENLYDCEYAKWYDTQKKIEVRFYFILLDSIWVVQ